MENLKRVSFYTLGCRLNIAETGSITKDFARRGYEIVPFNEESDICVVNTCTVTNNADSECRNIIRRAHKLSPNASIIVIGCYAQMAAETIKEIDGVKLVIGTADKHKIFEFLDEEDFHAIHIARSREFAGAFTEDSDSHCRAFLKVQDGCNYFCSYCIIPFARGRARSIKISEAVKEARSIVKNGYREIVLAGINMGEFGENTDETFAGLLRALIYETDIERIRLSSIEPNTVTDELLELMKHEKVMKHFHLPIQAASDEILVAMKRKYDLKFFREMVEKIRREIPNCAIGTDVIVGFPGETDEIFNQSVEVLKSLPLTHYHVFPYSVRKGTVAEKLPGQITGDVKKHRSHVLNELGKVKLAEYAATFKNTTVQVLFEKRAHSGLYEGHIGEFIKVYVDSEKELRNEILSVKIDDNYEDGLIGKLIEE